MVLDDGFVTSGSAVDERGEHVVDVPDSVVTRSVPVDAQSLPVLELVEVLLPGGRRRRVPGDALA
jgi:hypothetical protein